MTLRAAELALFGEATGSLSSRPFPPSGADAPDDMAQAWLDGDHEKANRLIAAYRARIAPLEPKAPRKTRGAGLRSWNRTHRLYDWARIRELRTNGHKLIDIARLIGCDTSQVSRICRCTKK